MAQKMTDPTTRIKVSSQIAEHMAYAVIHSKQQMSTDAFGNLLDMYSTCKDPDLHRRFTVGKQVHTVMQEKIREALDMTKDQDVESTCRMWHGLSTTFSDIQYTWNRSHTK